MVENVFLLYCGTSLKMCLYPSVRHSREEAPTALLPECAGLSQAHVKGRWENGCGRGDLQGVLSGHFRGDLFFILSYEKCPTRCADELARSAQRPE
jgi:hypothetical protein